MLLVKLITKHNFFTALFLLISLFTFSQENSPFSRYGLGDIYPGQTIASRAMGGLTAAFTDGQAINTYNPASYGDMRSYLNGGLVTFDVGLSFESRKLLSTNTVNSFKSRNLIPSYVQFGFPLSKKNLGLVFGLRPVTRINYNVSEFARKTFPTGFSDSVQTFYDGSGGLNQAFIGLGKRWGNFGVGFNTGFNFGRKETSTKISFFNDTVSYSRSNTVNTVAFHGFAFTGGLMYNINLSNHYDSISKLRSIYGLRLGINGTLQQTLNASTDLLEETFIYNADGAILPVDTVNYKSSIDGKIKMPSSYSIGFMLTKGIGNAYGSDYNWMIGAQYDAGNWGKDYRYYGQPDRVRNNWMIRAGAQISPNPLSGVGFFQRTTYRVGFFTGKDYLDADGKGLTTTGFTLGAGIHLRKFRSYDNQYTLINTALEFGKRGTNINAVRESYFKFSIGFSLSDIWFIKRKYD